MSQKILKIDAVCQDIPLIKPFKFASGSLSYLPYAWVRVVTEDGLVGYGECPTYWDPSGETQLAAIGAIQHVAPSIIGIEAYDFEKIFRIFDKISYGAFAAKCGLDMALYDIVGKWLGIPAYVLLGGSSSDIPVNAVIPLGIIDDQELTTTVKKLLSNGHITFKIKVGVDLKQETDLVRRLLEILPSEARVFLDANQAWGDAKTAIRAIRRFEKLGVVWVEQPVHAQDINGLRSVRQAVDVSIIADESLYSPVDALRLIEAKAVDMFNIKLAKCGGMFLGKKLFSLAQAGNINCMLGSMIESSLGMLANYHFAKAHPMVTCGLSAYTYVSEPVEVGIRFSNGQMLLDEERPGLGYPDPHPFERAFTE